ncbi:hypothetical protein Nepgr_026517 [Nepenthes gracilis]|uniref:Uncharacterized protein n=1 Tax=Nepenthes gracilis TaxID=150966 RepID=A0AAD3Y255_NEPGR|nr:hypothetical protein Nepgr_026517 [Nepenthes gracilis]
MGFPRFQWWLWGQKEIEQETSFTNSSSNSPSHLSLGLRDTDCKGARTPSSSQRKIKKKWQSREERRRVDKEYDVVLVPSNGVCLSGSESDDSDWSIGWLEPHGPDFLSDDETDDSFAVLVPCYKNDRKEIADGPNNQLLSAIKILTSEPLTEGQKLMEQWLSSLQTCGMPALHSGRCGDVLADVILHRAAIQSHIVGRYLRDKKNEEGNKKKREELKFQG